VTKGTTTKRLKEQWAEEERRLEPVSLEQAFLDAGLPKSLIAVAVMPWFQGPSAEQAFR